MLTLVPIAPPRAAVSRVNPAVKLAALSLLSLTALIASDWLTPTLLLTAVLLALPFSGVDVRLLALRLRLLWLAALSVAVVNAVFAADKGGAALVEFGPLLLTEANAQAGLALGLRVAAVAVPGVLAFATTDPTELADSLTQQLKAPPKFAIGALAAFRLLPLLAAEWRMIVLARRARGVEAGWNPIARVRLFASAMFVLLVGAIRRGGRLAVAMDARGFDAETPRGVARPQQVRLSDWLVLAGVAATCAAAIAVSATLGIFRAVF